MLDEAGSIDFADEVLDLVERLWCAYEEKMGRPASRKEQLLGLAYIIAALRQDVTEIGAQIAGLPELQGINLDRLLAEELGPGEAQRTASLKAKLRRRGWLVETR